LGPNGHTGASSVVADGNGILYVISSDQLLKETPSSSGYIESAVAIAGFTFAPLAVDGAGNVYFNSEDTSSNNIVKATLNAGVYTSSTIYSTSQSYYSLASYVAVDGGGDVFIINSMGDLLEEKPSGNTYSQSTIYSGLSSTYSEPIGIVVDGSSNIFISFSIPYGNKAVLELSPSSTGYIYSFIGSGINYPQGSIAVDGMGNLYLYNGSQMFKETYSNGSYVQSIIAEEGTTVDGAGNLYFPNGLGVEKVDNADPPSLSFQTTAKGATSTDSPQTVTVSSFGNEPLNISAVSYPLDFPEVSAAVGDCASGASLPASESCTLTIDFSPIAALGATPNELKESVSVTTNTLNTTATQQNVAVSGLESLNQPAPPPVFSLPSGDYSTPSFNLKVTDAAPGATINYTLLWVTPTSTLLSSPGVYSDQYPIGINFDGLIAVTIQATATAPGYLTSSVSTATYTYKDFSIQVSPSSISGSSGTATVTIAPLNSNGFPSPVTFSCTGVEQGYSCSFSPATVTPGNSTVSTTMTLKSGSSSSELHRHFSPLFPGSVLAVTLCCFGWRKRRSLQMLLLITVSIAGLSLINGCSFACPSCSKSPTTPVTLTLSVVATSGSASHTTNFSYVVIMPD
jgi:hypothetical protein